MNIYDIHRENDLFQVYKQELSGRRLAVQLAWETFLEYMLFEYSEMPIE